LPQSLGLICATIQNGEKIVSVHEWIQLTQKKATKQNPLWVITELGAHQDLRLSRKLPKLPALLASLWTDQEWRQPHFSA